MARSAPDWLVDLAGLYNSGQYDVVLGRCAMLVTEHPQAFELWNIYGAAHIALGEPLEAEACFRRACDINPGFADAQNNLGIALKAQGKLQDAIKAHLRAIEIRPDYAEAHNSLGIAYKDQGKPDFARASYGQAVAYRPDYADAHFNLGVLHKILGAHDKAVPALRKAISIKSDFAAAHNNLGAVLSEQGKFEDALQAFNRAAQIDPAYPDIHSNIGTALAALGRLDAAQEAVAHALKLKPKQPSALNNMGIILKDQGKLDDAITHFTQAIAGQPDYREAQKNMSHALLLSGEFGSGFELMEARLREGDIHGVRPPRKGLAWDGKADISGARFLVYQEQGLGDIIQFARYLPLLVQRGARVAFFVQPGLHHLLGSMDGNVDLITTLPAVEALDFEAALMSLPHLLGTTEETIPAAVPYIHADPYRKRAWADTFAADRFRVGICWQGSTTRKDLGRSFPLNLFAQLANIPGVELISLHKGEGEAQLKEISFQVTELGTGFDRGADAFADTAAVMAHCDLIITSDTAIAHVAGAMGRATWVVLQAVPDWRWMMARPDSPWYPSMVLYRQEVRNDWTPVFDRMARDLRALATDKCAAPDIPLIPVSWGELIDKITILGIKSEKLTDETALRNVGRERERLIRCYEGLCPDLAQGAQFQEDLTKVNAALWQIEDDLRRKERLQEFDDEFIALARSVYITNDERARIKKRIDIAFKSDLTEEKSYC